jgi:hypothetical protein
MKALLPLLLPVLLQASCGSIDRQAASPGEPSTGTSTPESSSAKSTQAHTVSREGLVGRWERLNEEHVGDVPQFLRAIEYLAIYPYRAYDDVPPTGIGAYGEIVYRAPEGDLKQLPHTSGFMQLWPDRMLFGAAVGWMFGYEYDCGNVDRPERLTLTWRWSDGEREERLRIDFRKRSHDPGERLSPDHVVDPLFPNWRQFQKRKPLESHLYHQQWTGRRGAG